MSSYNTHRFDKIIAKLNSDLCLKMRWKFTVQAAKFSLHSVRIIFGAIGTPHTLIVSLSAYLKGLNTVNDNPYLVDPWFWIRINL